MRGLDGARGRFTIALLVLAGVLARLVIVLRLDLDAAALGASCVACVAALLGVFWLLRGGFGAGFFALFGATFLPLPLHVRVLLLPAGQVSVGAWCVASMLLLGAWLAAVSPAASAVSATAGMPVGRPPFGPFFVGPSSLGQGVSALFALVATPVSTLLTLVGVLVAVALSGMLWVSPRGASASTTDVLREADVPTARDLDEAGWFRAFGDRWAPSWFSVQTSERANEVAETEDGNQDDEAADSRVPRLASWAKPGLLPSSQPPVSRELPTAAAPKAEKTRLPVPGSQPVADLLGKYYADLNANTFDAKRYFEPQVEQYITMRDTSTGAINRYIHHVFPKQFKQHHFSLEEGSLSREGPNQYVFVETSSYYMVAKRKQLDQRVTVRVRLSPGGKLVFFHQFKRLPKEPRQIP